MSTLPSQGDFVIVKEKTRKLLVQVSSVDTGAKLVFGTKDKDRAYNPQSTQHPVNDVLVNLGPKPMLGSVYSVQIEPYRKTIRHPQWGDVHLFHTLSSDQLKELKIALDRTYKGLQKHGLHKLIDAGNLAIEVRPPKGKNLGMYYFRQKGEEASDRLMIRTTDKPEYDKSKLFSACLYHEMGHALYWRGMSRKTRARWLRLYEEFCTFSEHKAADVQKIGNQFTKSLTSVKGFRTSLGEDEDRVILFDACIAQLCMDHRMSTKDIDIAIEGEDPGLIASLWPKHELRYSDFEEELGDYAMKNHKEFVSEAVRLFYEGIELPKSVRAVLEKTLRMAPGIIGVAEEFPNMK